MNVILLTAIFTVALVHGEPCENQNGNNAYNIFVNKHILKENIDRTSIPRWQRYLEEHNLCGNPIRVRQSFIEAPEDHVIQICSNAGRRVQGAPEGNLCISNARMQVYEVSVTYNNGCRVTAVNPLTRNVIVACDKVANQCRPVHYEAHNYEMLNNIPCI